MNNKVIYLDNNATTPCSLKVQEAICSCMANHWGNASSQHYIGRQAHRLLEDSRSKVACALGCRKSEIFFNSGATEGNNWIFLSLLKGSSSQRRIVISSIEHKSVLLSAKSLAKHGFEIIEMPVTKDGQVDLAQAKDLITEETVLVSCQYANNETGVIQPIKELCTYAHNAGALFHCDAVQGLGKSFFQLSDLEVDAATFSAHKIYGPQGVGALYLRGGSQFWKFTLPLDGGGQEQGVRPGTQNLPGIVGFSVAVEEAVNQLPRHIHHFAELHAMLEKELHSQIPGCIIHGENAQRIPNTTNVAIPGIPADMLMPNLPLFCLSNGSACNSGNWGVSYVLKAMGCSDKVARDSVRISTGIATTASEIELFITELIAFEKMFPKQKEL